MVKRIRVPTSILRGSPRATAELKIEVVDDLDVDRLDALQRQLTNGNLKTRGATVRSGSGTARILRPGVEGSGQTE